ncbi:MAG: CocE/NonD family hydrolase [Bacteroidales bacterium]|nr:CocE/NonD family hydrolase [Bacteroidales bacterium]
MKRIFFIFLLFVIILNAQLLQPFVKHIPMRDGKWLAADCYVQDTSGTIKYPTILIQTPYNRLLFRFGLPLGIGINLDGCPYAFVIVDWRGFYGSAAAAVPNPDRGKDGYDVIEWIVNQPWSNGKVGTWGPSALGKIQYLTAKENHPNHICAVPLVAAPQSLYLEYFPGGVYRKEYVDQLDALGFGLSSTLLTHPYYDTYWQLAEWLTFYPQNIRIPMFLIGGWFDHNIQLMLDFFAALQTQSEVQVRYKHKFLIGPWVHGGHGTSQVGTPQQGELTFPQAVGWGDSLALRFFDYYLRGINNNWENEPPLRFFIPGKNIWESTTSWQTTIQNQTSITLYLLKEGRLSDEPPTYHHDTIQFVYDPRNPSPTVGGMTLRNDLLQGPYDQSQQVESRNDIVVFTSDDFSIPVTVTGKIKVILWVSSDVLDTDFALRLTDVYPDGRSILVREQIQRMRFRKGYSQSDELFMQDDSIYRIEMNFYDISYTFLPQHKLRLSITSSNYPRFDINLNNGGPMYTSGDTLVARNAIHVGQYYPSSVVLPVDQYPLRINDQVKESWIESFVSSDGKWLIVKLNKNEFVFLTIYDIQGRIIWHGPIDRQVSVYTGNWKNGVYYIQAQSLHELNVEPIMIVR